MKKQLVMSVIFILSVLIASAQVKKSPTVKKPDAHVEKASNDTTISMKGSIIFDTVKVSFVLWGDDGSSLPPVVYSKGYIVSKKIVIASTPQPAVLSQLYFDSKWKTLSRTDIWQVVETSW